MNPAVSNKLRRDFPYQPDSIMWWDSQTFDQTRTTGSGEKLTFLVWHDAFTLDRIVVVARIFFWSEGKESAGVVLLGPGVNQHSRDIHNLIERLTADPHLRAKYQRTLRFPLERHYIAYGAFPEEREILEHLSNARSIAGSPPAP